MNSMEPVELKTVFNSNEHLIRRNVVCWDHNLDIHMLDRFELGQQNPMEEYLKRPVAMNSVCKLYEGAI